MYNMQEQRSKPRYYSTTADTRVEFPTTTGPHALSLQVTIRADKLWQSVSAQFMGPHITNLALYQNNPRSRNTSPLRISDRTSSDQSCFSFSSTFSCASAELAFFLFKSLDVHFKASLRLFSPYAHSVSFFDIF